MDVYSIIFSGFVGALVSALITVYTQRKALKYSYLFSIREVILNHCEELSDLIVECINHNTKEASNKRISRLEGIAKLYFPNKLSKYTIDLLGKIREHRHSYELAESSLDPNIKKELQSKESELGETLRKEMPDLHLKYKEALEIHKLFGGHFCKKF